jgi:hypothetical protein
MKKPREERKWSAFVLWGVLIAYLSQCVLFALAVMIPGQAGVIVFEIAIVEAVLTFLGILFGDFLFSHVQKGTGDRQ